MNEKTIWYHKQAVAIRLVRVLIISAVVFATGRFGISSPDSPFEDVPAAVVGVVQPPEQEHGAPSLPDDWVRRTETYTFYQTGGYFNPQTACQTDGVKVCIFNDPKTNTKLIKSHLDSKIPNLVEADFTAAQDCGKLFIDGRFDGKTHYDTVIKKKDGSDWQFGLLPGLPYILPTKEWNDYVASQLLVGIDAGASAVTLQELGVFGDSGYEQAFRDEWAAFYGTPWPSTLWTDPEHYYMGQDLRNYLAKRQVEQVFSAVKAYKPGVKTIFSNHTSQSYWGFYNSVGNHDTMLLDVVDGVEGQSWSNTIMLPFRYDGVSAERPFAMAFSEYGYWSVLGKQFPNKEVYVITDPKGDGFDVTNVPLKKCDDLYRHQIVSQLAFPNIYRYNTVVWPDRAMSRGFDGVPVATDDFRTVIGNIVSLQANMYKYQEPMTTDNRPIRAGAMLLDSLCYLAGGPENYLSYDSFYSSYAGLFYNGIMVDSIPAGREKSPVDVLKDYDLIIVNYDLMKPQNPSVSEDLAAYVNNGGVVLFFSGHPMYENMKSSWWVQSGLESPQDDLLLRVGVQTSGRKTGIKSAQLTPTDAALSKSLETLAVPDTHLVGYAAVGDAVPLYIADGGEIVAFEKPYGRGFFHYFGVDTNFFGDKGKGDVLFDIVKAVVAGRKSAALTPKGRISYRRGPIYGFASLTGEHITDQGDFINMFDPRLNVVHSLTVPEGGSELLYDVSDKLSGGKPAVLFAQGNNPAVYESQERIRVVTAGPVDTIGCIRVFLPGGKGNTTVTAVDGDGKDMLINSEYDDSSDTMLITYRNDLAKVIVDIMMND